jgi:hypothetical protein
MPEMTERVRQIIYEDHHRTTEEVSMIVGNWIGSHGTYIKMLTEDLKMRHVASKFIPRLLSVDQKQQRADIFLDLKENSANDRSCYPTPYDNKGGKKRNHPYNSLHGSSSVHAKCMKYETNRFLS